MYIYKYPVIPSAMGKQKNTCHRHLSNASLLACGYTRKTRKQTRTRDHSMLCAYNIYIYNAWLLNIYPLQFYIYGGTCIFIESSQHIVVFFV